MAAEELESKLNQWKQKYLELLARDEKTTIYTQLMERSLGRLALVAEGIHPDLDKQLHALRRELRGQKNVQQITLTLEKIQDCINDLDENPHNSDASELLRTLLLSLSVPTEYQANVDNLLIQLKDSPMSRLENCYPI